jgi:hypothetical protein
MQLISRCGFVAVAMATGALFLAGCGKPKASGPDSAATDVSNGAGPHGDWWCTEHGIPEEMCSMCSAKYAQQCKDKGDWCEEHNRAKSQCFKCDTSLKEKFAAMYRAKYPGKEPPPIED